MMTQKSLPFQYVVEKKDSGLTGHAGLPLFIELAHKSGFADVITKTLVTKERGWSDAQIILSLILLNLVGGDCITDINHLENDTGLRLLLAHFETQGMSRPERRAYIKKFRKLKKRGLPCTATIHRFLAKFHDEPQEALRVEGEAFIPAKNEHLQHLCDLNTPLILAAQTQCPSKVATIDQDATLTHAQKRQAKYCYKGFKAYQPFNTYWHEHGMLLHSEFRDGNVNAGYEQLRVFKEVLGQLPDDVETVYLRSDSAGYQADLLRFCAEEKSTRFDMIEFAIAIKVSQEFKKVAKELPESAWQTLYLKVDDQQIPTTQQWAEVCFVPTWAGLSKKQPSYRFLAIREKMKPAKSGKAIEELDLPFQTMKVEQQDYKLFGVVTNRDLPGNELIQWHRERCGNSEHAHSTQKSDLAGGQLPSNKFGANAAWWQVMVLAFNLNRLMQIVALPKSLKNKKMKALRFHIIDIPGRVIRHARQFWLSVEAHSQKLFDKVRRAISEMKVPTMGFNTS